jgi:hypothetical protein
MVSRYAPSLGEPFGLSFVTFCEIADEVIPEIMRMEHGREPTAGERLIERERRPDYSLPPSPADGAARQRRTKKGNR